MHLRNTDIPTLEMLSFSVGMQPEFYVSFSAPTSFTMGKRVMRSETKFWREIDE